MLLIHHAPPDLLFNSKFIIAFYSGLYNQKHLKKLHPKKCSERPRKQKYLVCTRSKSASRTRPHVVSRRRSAHVTSIEMHRNVVYGYFTTFPPIMRRRYNLFKAPFGLSMKICVLKRARAQ